VGLGEANIASGHTTAISAVWTSGFPGNGPDNVVACYGTGGCTTIMNAFFVASNGRVNGGAIGDLDGDHIDDVLLSSYISPLLGPPSPPTVTMLKGTGTTNPPFVAATAPAALNGHTPGAIYDLDQDGYPDVGADGMIFWGDASQSFAASSPFGMSPKADFDGDGNLDLYAYSSTARAECLIFGAGSRVFGQRILFTPTGFNLTLLANISVTFDLNGDGADDGYNYQSQTGVASFYVSTAKTAPGTPDIQCGSLPAAQCTGPSGF
jgi:hypothetical protein